MRRPTAKVDRGVRVLCTLGAALAALLTFAAPPALADNPIQAENALPGDSHWTAALQDPPSGTPHIEGYADATSVRPGGTIGFHVSTNPVARYRIEISRLGWYGGAGGRRLVCLVGSQLDASCSVDHLGAQQPRAPAPDPATGELRAGWSTTDELDVPATWISGYYIAVFVLTSGPDAGQTGFTPFIVQAPLGDHSAILVQVPTNTWEAYNWWGGQDFYSNPRAVKISFDRPFAHRLLFNWEYPLVRFLERGGWDVSYAADDDVDSHPSILLDHQLDMTAGHDEYWTKAMRDGWEAARAAGVNLAFMGANNGYWQVRYEDGGRTLVGYKTSPDPDPDQAETTTEFRLLARPRPECELMGVEYQGTTLLRGQYLDYTAASAISSDSWFARSGLSPGTVLPGLVGYETDAVTPGCHLPPVTPLLSSPPGSSPGDLAQSDAVRYTACSGAEVFSSGSLQFSWGLDSWRDPSYSAPLLPPAPPANAALQAGMTRALQDLTQSHVPRPGPPELCVPSPDFTASAQWAVAGQPITFTSAAVDNYGEIGSQTWSFTEGDQTKTATGDSVTETFARGGLVQVRLLSSDTSGASAADVQTIRVCPGTSRSEIAWPLEAQTGADCELTPIGVLHWHHHQLRLVPHGGLSNITMRIYRVKAARGRIRLAPVAPPLIALADSPFTVHAPRAPTVIDVTAQAAGLTVRQQFLVPDPGNSRGPVEQLSGLACDGTSATILTPGFRGRRSEPLRVQLRGAGRLTVVVASIGGRMLYRRDVTSRGRQVTLSFPARAFAPGLYRITVSARRSRLHEPLILNALAL